MSDTESSTGSLSVRYRQPRELDIGAAGREREPEPGHVVVAPAYVGICGTDLHIYLGHLAGRVAPGTILGHESSGVIARVGPDVTGWSVGDNVCVFPILSCGTCRTCAAGREHVCPRLRILGIDDDGAMQGAWAVPAANLVGLPDDLSLRTAGLIEPLAVAVHDVHRSRLTPGEHALVAGAGPVGLLIAMVAREAGARVTLVELSEHRRRLAARLGFHVLAPDGVAELSTAGGAPDVAFEVTGVEPALKAAYECLTPGGRLVVVGIHAEPRPFDLQSLFQREIDVLGARLYTRAHFAEAVELVRSGRVDPSPLISDVVGFEAAGDAFDRLLTGGDGAMKILVAAKSAEAARGPSA